MSCMKVLFRFGTWSKFRHWIQNQRSKWKGKKILFKTSNQEIEKEKSTLVCWYMREYVVFVASLGEKGKREK